MHGWADHLLKDWRVSIFYKDCPHCAATLSASTKRCSCGHYFVFENEAEPGLDPELHAQEEKLYEAYLTARRDQTAETVRAARAEVFRAPGNAAAIDLLKEAEAALNACEAELSTQMEKSSEAQKLAVAARGPVKNASQASPAPTQDGAPTGTPITASAEKGRSPAEKGNAPSARIGKPLPVSDRSEARMSARKTGAGRGNAEAKKNNRAVAEPRAPETRSQLKAKKTERASLAKARAEALAKAEAEKRARLLAEAEEAAKAAREEAAKAAREEAAKAAREEAAKAAREEAAKAAREEAAKAAREEAAKAAREEAAKAAREEAAKAAREEAAKAAREEAAKAARDIHTKHVTHTTAAEHTAAMAHVMPEQTERLRRELAEQAFRTVQTAKAQQTMAATRTEKRVTQSSSGTAFRAAQSARAAQIVAASEVVDTKECPTCTATVALLARSCRCGYTFPTGSTEMPVLTLSAAELAEILGTRQR